ncbi:hypothetical protein F8154_11065 [Alkaliphilus pronyensis]|uniref:Uncharacterized protein n=1 Tax=Alkaliphilus pronyensis TaxID=1482732 RepID=A0A6I0F6M7_9FIRM|nr:hypothetical protein [Alkaliphilus pronyensis]KAB3532933.1 hypothetical protein F8154_11065 [Alkaliphilus pronyensis]
MKNKETTVKKEAVKEKETIEDLRNQYEELKLKLQIVKKEEALNSYQAKKSVREAYTKKKLTDEPIDKKLKAFETFEKALMMMYFKFNGIATIKQLETLDKSSKLNWKLLKKYGLCKVVEIYDVEVYILSAFSLNHLLGSSKQKTIRLSTLGLRKQLYRNNWNINNFYHKGNIEFPDDLLADDNKTKHWKYFKETHDKLNVKWLAFNNVNYQMLIVDEQIRRTYQTETSEQKKVFKDNATTSKEKIDKLIKSGSVKEERFYDITNITTVEPYKSHILSMYKLNRLKDSFIRKATKGEKFSPSSDDIKNYALTSIGGKEIQPYFFFDLFRDSFVNVNFTVKNNIGTLYFDYIDYTDSIGRKKAKELINKVENLVNIAYTMCPFNVQLNIWTSERNGKKLGKDNEVKKLLWNSSVKMKCRKFDYGF